MDSLTHGYWKCYARLSDAKNKILKKHFITAFRINLNIVLFVIKCKERGIYIDHKNIYKCGEGII